MAEEENTTPDDKAPENPHVKRIGLNRILIIVSLIITSVVAIAAGVTLYLTASSIPDFNDDENSQAELILRIDELEETLRRLSQYKSDEMAKMQTISKQAEQLQLQCSQGINPKLLAAMQQRETDFQLLIVELQNSSRELASMTRSSRDWLVEHSAALNQLRDKSVNRSVNLQYVE